MMDDHKRSMTAQAELNRSAFESDDQSTKEQFLGFAPGKYVRIVLTSVPCEMVHYFSPERLLIVGGLLPSEDKFGLLQVRIKKHRWHKKILKNQDPLIFSLGWRRFQSIPLYCIEDRSYRKRQLKYTPEHMHCLATFHGPV